MSTPTRDELAERAVACKHWQWLAGMLSSDTGLRLDEFTLEEDWEAKYPDLSDPLTMWGLLAILREVRGPCSFFKTDDGWEVHSPHGVVWSRGKSEAEALVKAMEAAE